MTNPVPTYPGQCVHVWVPRPALSTPVDSTYTEECARCGSRCSRDPKTGLINAYVRNTPKAATTAEEEAA